MKPPMPWIGGKQALTETLCALFPPEFIKYVEVFGGGGALLFHKPPGQFEVYNDKNYLRQRLGKIQSNKSCFIILVGKAVSK